MDWVRNFGFFIVILVVAGIVALGVYLPRSGETKPKAEIWPRFESNGRDVVFRWKEGANPVRLNVDGGAAGVSPSGERLAIVMCKKYGCSLDIMVANEIEPDAAGPYEERGRHKDIVNIFVSNSDVLNARAEWADEQTVKVSVSGQNISVFSILDEPRRCRSQTFGFTIHRESFKVLNVDCLQR